MFGTSAKSLHFYLSNGTKLVLAGLKLKGDKRLNLFFNFYFLIQDFSLNVTLIFSKLDMHIHNIHLEGTVSQIFYIGPCFIFMTKNGKNFNYFS